MTAAQDPPERALGEQLFQRISSRGRLMIVRPRLELWLGRSWAKKNLPKREPGLFCLHHGSNSASNSAQRSSGQPEQGIEIKSGEGAGMRAQPQVPLRQRRLRHYRNTDRDGRKRDRI